MFAAVLNGFDAATAWLIGRVHDPATSEDLSENVRARLRARQVEAIARMTLPLMAANIMNALALLIVLDITGQGSWVATIWAAIAVTIAAVMIRKWHQRRRMAFPATLGTRTIRRLIGNAAFMGLVWAVPGLLILPHAQGSATAFIITMHAGMVAGGTIALYPIPAAAMVYASAIFLGGFIGFAMRGDPTILGYALVTAAFVMTVWRIISRHARIFVAEFVGRLQLDQQKAVIEALLMDTRAEADEERARSERRLAQAQKMEAIGQLTAGIAHDFNNLLAAVQGNAELLEIGKPEDAELVRSILHSTRRGSELVNRLLSIGRKQHLSPESVDLERLIERMATLFERTLGPRICIRTGIGPDMRPALADRVQLEAAVLNLALNARDAMPDGGTMTMSCANVAPDEAGAPPGNPMVRISVSDTGQGMSPQVRERAVEPFFTTKEFGAGSGLGLSTVHGFAEQSRGRLSIDSIPGHGTTMSITLPSPVIQTAIAAEEDLAAPGARGEAILVVEDDPDVRVVTARTLTQLGYRVTEAADAAAALDVLNSADPPDLVLSDVMLPGGTSGYDLGRSAGDDLRFVYMSGFTELATEAAPARRPTLLRKPFSREDLARFVRRALDDA